MTDIELLKQALYHLKCVCGSRNSFSSEVIERLFIKGMTPIKNLRTEGVEEMHHNAVNFLNKHKHLIDD